MLLPETIYHRLTLLAREDYRGIAMSESLSELTLESAKYLLKDCDMVSLKSRVEGKEYVSFTDQSGKLSRPVNKNLFMFDITQISNICDLFAERTFKGISEDEMTKLLYTMGICFPCFIDLKKTNDKKTGGTFFEFFIGHIFAYRFGTNPRKQLEIPVVSNEEPKLLPTDLIFDLPKESYGFHVPIKSTTRERVIQVWAHQRILDGVYGTGKFLGILIVASETKLDTSKREVIEICLPSQWRIYQLHIAKLSRIYYLDPPEPYLNLNKTFPHLGVKSFAQFFGEEITSS